jgi:cytoskeleton protein RodZ
MMETTDTVANPEKDTTPKPLNVGMALREAREAQGMSVHDVADRVKFAPKQVEALEANDFAHLPQTTFLRGFVRSYARVLQLDEAPLLAALPADPAKQPVAGNPAVNVAFPTVRALHRINALWLAGALGVALVLGLFVLLGDSGEATQTTSVVESVPLPMSQPDAAASAVADAGVQPALPVPDKAATPETAVKPVKAAESVAAVAPQIGAASAPVAVVKPPIPLEILKRRPLHFVFGVAAWAEVVDVNGSILLSRTNPAGSEQWVGGPGRAPYDISIAHPGSVKLYYKGKEIDLSAYAAMEVAHLKVE